METESKKPDLERIYLCKWIIAHNQLNAIARGTIEPEAAWRQYLDDMQNRERDFYPPLH